MGERSIKIYTGVGGMDLFEECLEEQCGFKRLYMSKVPRILRRIKGIRILKSRTGRWYRRVGRVEVRGMDYTFESYRIAP